MYNTAMSEDEFKRITIPLGFTAYALQEVFDLKREMLVHEAQTGGKVPDSLMRQMMRHLVNPGVGRENIEAAFDAVVARPGDRETRRALTALIDPLKLEFAKKVVPPGDPLRQSFAEIVAHSRDSDAAAGLENKELREKITGITNDILAYMKKGAPVPRPLEKKLVLLLLRPGIAKQDAAEAFDAVCKDREDKAARRRLLDMLDRLRIWTSDAHRLMSPEREPDIMTRAFSRAAQETDATEIRNLIKPGPG